MRRPGRSRRGTLPRPRTWALPCGIVAIALVLLGSAVGTAGGASSSVTITASVPSSVALTNSCTQTPAWNLGVVLPGDTALSDRGGNVCRFSWQSSNDTSMLRVYQKDQTGTAMTSQAVTQTASVSSTAQMGPVAVVPSVPNTAWVGGSGSQVLKTTDNGATWTTQNMSGCPAGAGIYDLVAVDANTVWAVGFTGSGGWVCRTTDGGSTWGVPANVPTGSTRWLSIDAASTSTIYVAGIGKVFRTSDAGATAWVDISAGITSGRWINGIDVVDSANVYLAGGDVWRTTTSGSSWTIQSISGCYVLDVAAATATTAWAVGDTNCIRKTSDGATWTSATAPGNTTRYRLESVYAVSTTLAYAAGTEGAVFRTSDGTNWTQVANPGARVRDIMATATTAYASGSGALRMTSTDGVTWVERGTTVQTLYGVAAVSNQVAWVVGGSGTIRKTTNGGGAWATQSVPGSHLRGVAALDASTAWAVGQGGRILRTTDGSTWSAQSSGTSVDLTGVGIVDASTVYVSGHDGTILKTTSGGSVWTNVGPGGGHLHGIAVVDRDTVWAVGEGGRIVKTTNGGASWASQASGTTNVLRSISALDGQVAWAAGAWNTGAKTLNGGTTWTAANYGSWVNAVAVASPDVVWLAGENGTDRTEDFGASYTGTWSATWDQDQFAIAAVDTNTAWSVTDGGAIYRYVSTGPSVPDYAASGWGTAGTALFGMCMQAVGASTTPVWTRDTTGTAGLCEPADTDPWYAIPASPAKVANTTTAGATGQADFVFAFRAAAGQAKGTYRATLVFEALAPNV